ncbi:MAG: alpha-galactosidase, partial [Clostridiales bacterium]|nr:alpha-galactosidase [Clostridiales bacterium]
GTRAEAKDGYVTSIGTFDGTAPDHSPAGPRSSELIFEVEASEDGTCDLFVTYASDASEGAGQWLQVAVGEKIYFDALLAPTQSPEAFKVSPAIQIELKAGTNKIRIMNHRRQENTLDSYARIRRELENAGDRDIVFSICEWGKTQPQNWGHKVGDSWRILNDITFQVGSDGNNGTAAWEGDYTTSITSQYNKAVIMDEFAGLTKGWNDPDMLVIGMDGIDSIMCRSHMAMWCMMNSPLMLGLDLRRVSTGDEIYNIIANEDLIALDRDPQGVQAKRIFTTHECSEPDKEYIRDNNRIDILAKPLSNGDIALGFFNLSKDIRTDDPSVTADQIMNKIGGKAVNNELFESAKRYIIKDLYTGEVTETESNVFSAGILGACDSKVIRITPVS